jgi:hypothetical protein
VPALPGQLVRPRHAPRSGQALHLVRRALGIERLRLARERSDADRVLLGSSGAAISSSLAWRVAELTNGRERRALASSLGDLVGDLSPRRLPGAAPLNRAGLRPYSDLLLALADRLERPDLPVTPAGILLVRELLSNGGSPLYLYGDAEALPSELERIHDALDGR